MVVEKGLTTAEEQEKFLADGLNVVKQQCFFMKRSLDGGNMREALKHASQMLSELRTSKLSPQKYYELYVSTFDGLQHLESAFRDENQKGRSCVDLYEVVQHCGNIVPRLYLLCTVGSVYIRSKEGPAKEVLNDLAEICKGVQHPIRGLFLRAYLTQISRDKLPDVGSPYEGEGGSVSDAVEFLVLNFTEMNKLWVRMQHQGPAADKAKREQERRELRDLVGKNIHMLSQLEGVTLPVYQSTVLQRILEQVVNCRDEIAQQYLMDCIIQVFPDDFHVHTLDTLLGAFPQLQPNVDVHSILSQLMSRLSKYAASNAEALPVFLEVDAFSKFSTVVQKVAEAHADMPLVRIVSLHLALLQFVIKVYKDRLDCVDQVLASCAECLAARGGAKDSATTKQLVQLLSTPLDDLPGGVETVLRLEHYAVLMAHLDFDTNRQMAVRIVTAVVKHATKISTTPQVEGLFLLIKELLQDSPDAPAAEADPEDFAEEQNLVARLVHFLTSPDPPIAFEILTAASVQFLKGGPKRLVHTIPPLVFSALQLIGVLGIDDAANGELVPQTVFLLLQKILTSLADAAPPLALRLLLQCAEVASSCDLEPMSYDLFTQAYMIYEEDIADSKIQVTALHLIIGTLQRCYVFTDDNRDTLTHKASAYSSKLLKKADQCRAVYECAHLFWTEDPRGKKDGERVLLCLKRALKIANAAQQMASARGTPGAHVLLLVEILNKYLYFFDHGNEHITPTVIQGLLELIKGEMPSADASQDSSAHALYRSTLAFIREQKSKQGAPTADKYALIQT